MVNRSVPEHSMPQPGLVLPDDPSVDQIKAARIFSEPLTPVGHEPTAEENHELARALRSYGQRSAPDDFSALEQFVGKNPDSAWTPALLSDLATEYYNTGWYSKCLKTWEKAWPALKDATAPEAKALGDRAAGELAYMYARLGRMGPLEGLLDSVGNRNITGSATERISGAKQGLWVMQNRPGVAFKCGPFALDRILAYEDPMKADNPLIQAAQSTTNGCALEQVAELSRKVGLNYQMAYRSKGAALLMPAVVNWKVGHYAALIKEENGRFLLQDPTFGNDVWVSRGVMEEESSGYFLVPPGRLPPGWRSVSEAEGRTVFGKGSTANSDPNSTTACYDPKTSCGESKGMAVASAHLMLVSLNIEDTPVSYLPPVGYPVAFQVVYNQREANQPAIFSYSNLGPKWTFNWLAYITDNPSSPAADVNYYVAGGGTLPFTGFNPTNQTFAIQLKSQALLMRTSTNSYEMSFRDGSKIIFAQPGSVGGTSRQVFMTQMIDPAGNAVNITYDADFRVVAVTDAIGQVTTFSYGDTNDILKITQVTDPFGRYATFTYDASNRLAEITDAIGLTSQFQYDSGDFIQAMITPYGTNLFSQGDSGRTTWLLRTYPDGTQERLEYNESATTGIPDSDPVNTVPAGMGLLDEYHVYRNTFFWDRKAYAEAPNDYSKAHIYHWLHEDVTDTVCSGILESEKPALENRIWNTYDGQPDSIHEGTTAQPNAIARVLDDGTTQVTRFKHDAFGNVTNSIDPAGRSMTFDYATNGVDLLDVRQTTGTNNDLVAQYSYNTQHLPVAIQDAAGQLTTNTYNARGQLLTTTDPKGETTTLTYDTNGYLLSVDGPLAGSGDTYSFTYDAVGRIRTATDPDGYTVTNSYDNLDRLTNIAYPDGTFSAFTYDKLDLVTVRDREGRETFSTYDALRRLTSIQDPLNRVVQFQYCDCGALSALIDPMGRPTRWDYDLEGRVTSRQYVDGSRVLYTYENTTSRLKSAEDETGQIKTYNYTVDDNLSGVSYGIAQVATPGVTFTYDTNYNRLVSMQDGIGTTTYTYNPAGTPGALQVASVNGPWANDTVSYQYDALGRVVSRAINGVAQNCAYDVLGRITNVVNALGSFNYDYDGPTERLLDAFYPNGQTTHYAYFDNTGDRRLQSITNLKPDATLISRFTYGYSVVGAITNWLQELGTVTNNWNVDYDAADQLVSILESQGTTNINQAFGYDPAGNRLFETIGATNRTFQYSAVNQLTSSSDTTLTNVTYEWDAEHRLAAVNQGPNRSEFYYDGLGRRCRIVEKTNGVVQFEARYVWCGMELCEERDTNNAVVQRFFGQGFVCGGTNYFYTRDHLGSVRELTDPSGQVQAAYDYDAFGNRTTLSGSVDSTFGFTGLPEHSRSGLWLALYRPYDSGTGRWLGRDPIGELGGINLYGYVANDPLNGSDVLGLCFHLNALARLRNAALGLYSGGAGGAAAGSVVGAAGGAVFGAGVGAAPGWLAGAVAGAGVGGAYGFFSGLFSDPCAGALHVIGSEFASGAGAVVGGVVAKALEGSYVITRIGFGLAHSARWQGAVAAAGDFLMSETGEKVVIGLVSALSGSVTQQFASGHIGNVDGGQVAEETVLGGFKAVVPSTEALEVPEDVGLDSLYEYLKGKITE